MNCKIKLIMILYFCKLNKFCRSGETGRRTGLKIQRWQHRAGSTPAFGTKQKKVTFVGYYFFIYFTLFRFLGGPLRVGLSVPDRNKLLPACRSHCSLAKNLPQASFLNASILSDPDRKQVAPGLPFASLSR